MSKATDIEKQNLEAHVELCSQRYEALELRLDSIELRVCGLQKCIEESHASMIKVLIGVTGTIITAVASVLVVLLQK